MSGSTAKCVALVWPEGQPERVRVCNTKLAVFWALYGPRALFSWRRMAWATGVPRTAHPIRFASDYDRILMEWNKL